KFFPAEQFSIRFYENVQKDPVRFLQDICDFLGVKFNADYFKKTVYAEVNSSGPASDRLPLYVRQYAAHKYHEETKKLAQRFGGPAANWLHDVEELIHKDFAANLE